MPPRAPRSSPTHRTAVSEIDTLNPRDLTPHCADPANKPVLVYSHRDGLSGICSAAINARFDDALGANKLAQSTGPSGDRSPLPVGIAVGQLRRPEHGNTGCAIGR